MGKVTAICISEKKGTQKKNIHIGEFIADFGIKNDAHAGNWHGRGTSCADQLAKAISEHL